LSINKNIPCFSLSDEGGEIFLTENKQCSTSLLLEVSMKGKNKHQLNSVEQSQKLSVLIAEIERLKQQLKETEENYHNTIEYANDAILTTDAKGIIISFNSRAERMFGYNREEIIGKPASVLLPIDKRREEKEKFKNMKLNFKGALSGSIGEGLGKTKDGTTFPLEGSFYLFQPNGKYAVTGIIRDISERKKIEAQLRGSEERARTLLNAAPDVALLLDNKGTLIDCNEVLRSRFNKSREELLGKTFFDMFSGDEAKKRFAFVKKVISKGKPVHYQDIIRGKWFDLTFHPLLDEKNRTTHVVIFAHNITELKQKEEDLVELKNFLENLIESSLDAILVTDNNGCIIKANRSFLHLFGYKKNEVLEKSMVMLMPREERTYKSTTGESVVINKEYFNDLVMMVSRLASEGKVSNWKTHILAKNKKCVPVEISAASLNDKKGTGIGSISILRNITERKLSEAKIMEYQNQLRSLAAKAISIEERNQQYLAAFLHDTIGQGLFGLKIKLNMLHDSKSFEESKAYASGMLATIDQLIANARSLTSELSPPILHEFGLGAALEWLAEQVHKREGIIFQFEDDGHSRSFENTINIVIFNAVRELFNNIVKHAKAHNVKVSIKSDDTNVQVSIEDNGIGFNHAEINVTRNNSNAFGLFSIKERLRYVGGHMDIKSKLGHGTRVTINMPRKQIKGSQ
jgi:PAS domain S-box-containing protein